MKRAIFLSISLLCVFFIYSQAPVVEELNFEDYYSHVSHNPQYGKTIILPRIVLSLREGQMINPILAKYPDILAIEETNGVKYILRGKQIGRCSTGS